MQRRAMSLQPPKTIAVIGAGLAGAALASAFAHAGYCVIVLEQSAAPAAGASGVPIALFAPSVSSDDAQYSRLLRQGVHLLMHELHRLTDAGLLIEGADWALTGVLERCIRGDKKLPSLWLEPADPIRLQSKVDGKSKEIFHGAAGWVNPKRLISSWLAHPNIQIQTNTWVDGFESLDADVIVVATGYQTPTLVPSLQSVLQPIRGQVEWGAQHDFDRLSPNGVTSPVNGMGHFIQTPSAWVAGATFQRDETDLVPRAKDVDKNFEKLAILMPELTSKQLDYLRAQSLSWVGVRAAQKNRQPLVQKIDTPLHRNVWICAGLGSRGLSLAALFAASILASAQI
jgi:tRNA 5-methylaminomethyl-2-thiouridine biosynthesis bifunctional protein